MPCIRGFYILYKHFRRQILTCEAGPRAERVNINTEQGIYINSLICISSFYIGWIHKADRLENGNIFNQSHGWFDFRSPLCI